MLTAQDINIGDMFFLVDGRKLKRVLFEGEETEVFRCTDVIATLCGKEVFLISIRKKVQKYSLKLDIIYFLKKILKRKIRYDKYWIVYRDR